MSSKEHHAAYRVPPLQPAGKYQSDKGQDNMYPFNSLHYNMSDVEDTCQGIRKPLSLFAPYPHENAEPAIQKVEMERPVTPINEEVKTAPAHFHRLAKLIRRRIASKPEVEELPIEDQKELSAIIMGEVNGIWPDIRNQADDPFLDVCKNRELQRRIIVHVVTVCEYLFIHYLNKARILNKRGVFSGPANMSRLKAQLALDSNQFLNILTIRRYIAQDLRSSNSNVDQCEEERGSRSMLPQQPVPALSYKALIEASRPKSHSTRHKYVTVEEAIQELDEKMPLLDTGKLLALIQDLPDARDESKMTGDLSMSSSMTVKPHHQNSRSNEDHCWEKMVLQKSDSVPLLHVGETLMEELGIDTSRKGAASVTDDLGHIATPHQATQAAGVRHQVGQPPVGSWEHQQMDLQRLVGGDREPNPTMDGQVMDDQEDDLPPLLQAVSSTWKQEQRQEVINQRLQELEEQQALVDKQTRVEMREASHPQPATVHTRLPNNMVVRASDVRVSDRVCLSSITLQKNATVYNDIIDEIDPTVVKKLDSNLFFGDEITEVYQELMKTVPTDHLLLDNDTIIEPTAVSVNLSSALASATLSNPPATRVINPDLQTVQHTAPWGSLGVKDWAKTPLDPPRDLRGRPLIRAMTPRGLGVAVNDVVGEPNSLEGLETGQPVSDMPDAMARSYASWLQWWRNTINTDDYMKYLSTQESDYMGVVFHFYNSDDEDMDDDDVLLLGDKPGSRAAARAAALAARRNKTLVLEEEKKLEELKAQKAQFNEGFWNVNSVLMGGLGQDPELPIDETTARSKTEVSDITNRSHVCRSRTVVSRRSHKQASDVSSVLSHPNKRERSTSRLTSLSQTDTKVSATTETKTTSEPTAQQRLEKVWKALHTPDGQKLDMAIKYSSDQYHSKLQQAIDEWEHTCCLVLHREALVTQLEDFERLASDPNRFFEKGARGSSISRLDEERVRRSLYKKISCVESELKNALDFLKKEFNDIVTYKGRPYTDKMQWDRTEMLYWLQEERKQQALDYEARIRNISPLPLKLTHLQPISQTMSESVN